MAYATLQDVRDAAPQLRIGGAGGLDQNKAERLVLAMNAQVEGILKGLGYRIPLDPLVSPHAVEIVKDIIVQGSIAQILKALFFGIKDPNDVGANLAWREYLAKLKALIDPDNPFTLDDAPIDDQAAKVAAELSASFTELGVVDILVPSRNQVF